MALPVCSERAFKYLINICVLTPFVHLSWLLRRAAWILLL